MMTNAHGETNSEQLTVHLNSLPDKSKETECSVAVQQWICKKTLTLSNIHQSKQKQLFTYSNYILQQPIT